MRTEVKGVIFGHMHEDHSCELALVPRLPSKRVMVVASGGDLALLLASVKMEVIAVDSNPAQIRLLRRKMECPENLLDLCFCGRVDRVLRRGGPLLAWLLDWPRLKPGHVRRFLTFFGGYLLSLAVFLVHGWKAGKRLDGESIRLIHRRLELAMRRPRGDRNPWLQVLLGNEFGIWVPEVWSPQGIDKWKTEVGRIDCVTGDISEVLRETPPASVGLIALSNLPDAMSRGAWNRLVTCAADALAPGGYLVVRSMLSETVGPENDRLFSNELISDDDASPLCPVVWIGRKR